MLVGSLAGAPLHAGKASAFVCQSDEEVCAAAAKEGANPARNFVWGQLRELGSFLEQRSWHRCHALC